MTAEEEIEAGLKNAVERGVPLEKAVQTFINAGYSESSVRSAAHAVSDMPISSQLVSAPKADMPTSTVSKLEDKKVEYKPTPLESAAAQQQMLPTANSPVSQEQNKVNSAQPNGSEGVSKTKIIILVVILVLLLVVLGASLVFRDQILAMLA